MDKYRVLIEIPELDSSVYGSISGDAKDVVLTEISTGYGLEGYIEFINCNQRLLNSKIRDMTLPAANKKRITFGSTVAELTELIEQDQYIVASYDNIINQLLASGFITYKY